MHFATRTTPLSRLRVGLPRPVERFCYGHDDDRPLQLCIEWTNLLRVIYSPFLHLMRRQTLPSYITSLDEPTWNAERSRKHMHCSWYRIRAWLQIGRNLVISESMTQNLSYSLRSYVIFRSVQAPSSRSESQCICHKWKPHSQLRMGAGIL